jgi:hypothetical protein
VITFEEKRFKESGMANRITKVNQSNLPWLVITDDNVIQGFT